MSINFDMLPFENFDVASRAVLNFLHDYLDLDLCMMTRVDGEDWIVLQAGDNNYGVEDGDVFVWADSFCSRMVVGDGPRIAPDAMKIENYQKAPIAQQISIGSYVGVPVLKANGELFGTLCAVDPDTKDDSLGEKQAMVELLAQLLGTILAQG